MLVGVVSGSRRNLQSRTQLEWFHWNCMLRSQGGRRPALSGGPDYRFGGGEDGRGLGVRARCGLDG